MTVGAKIFIIDSCPVEWSEQHLLIFCHISSAKKANLSGRQIGFYRDYISDKSACWLCCAPDNNANKFERMSWRQSSLEESDGNKYGPNHWNTNSLSIKYSPRQMCWGGSSLVLGPTLSHAEEQGGLA